MPQDNFIFTTKDFTILEIMLDRLSATADPIVPLLRRKLDRAIVVFRDDLPPHVATLSSRVGYRVDDGEADMRILTHQPARSPVGLFLPITAPRGLALLGLCEAQEVDIETVDGRLERLVLDKVLYQPEAARLERDAMARSASPASRRADLRVIAGSRPAIPVDCGGSRDGPGPSAA